MGDGGGLAFVGLALEAGVPERSEIVGYILGRVGRMDLPVLRQRRLSVGVVQEAVWLEINRRVL